MRELVIGHRIARGIRIAKWTAAILVVVAVAWFGIWIVLTSGVCVPRPLDNSGDVVSIDRVECLDGGRP